MTVWQVILILIKSESLSTRTIISQASKKMFKLTSKTATFV